MREVTTWVDLAGQFVTSGAQLVTVKTEVLKMVDVVSGIPALAVTGLPGAMTEAPNEVDRFPFWKLWPIALVGMAGAVLAWDSDLEVLLTCLMVAEAEPQSKPIL